VPEFRNNFLTFSATPKVNIDISNLAEKLVPIPTDQIPQVIQRWLSTPVTHNLHQRKDKIDYRALHLGHKVNKTFNKLLKMSKENAKQSGNPCVNWPKLP